MCQGSFSVGLRGWRGGEALSNWNHPKKCQNGLIFFSFFLVCIIRWCLHARIIDECMHHVLPYSTRIPLEINPCWICKHLQQCTEPFALCMPSLSNQFIEPFALCVPSPLNRQIAGAPLEIDLDWVVWSWWVSNETFNVGLTSGWDFYWWCE